MGRTLPQPAALHVHCPCGSALANSLCSSLAHTGSTPASLNPQPSPFPLEQSQPGTIPGFWHHGFVGNVGNHPHHSIHKSELGIAIPCSARGRNGSQKRGPDPIHRQGGSDSVYLGTPQERSYPSAARHPARVLKIGLRSKAAASPSITPQPVGRTCLAP